MFCSLVHYYCFIAWLEISCWDLIMFSHIQYTKLSLFSQRCVYLKKKTNQWNLEWGLVGCSREGWPTHSKGGRNQMSSLGETNVIISLVWAERLCSAYCTNKGLTFESHYMSCKNKDLLLQISWSHLINKTTLSVMTSWLKAQAQISEIWMGFGLEDPNSRTTWRKKEMSSLALITCLVWTGKLTFSVMISWLKMHMKILGILNGIWLIAAEGGVIDSQMEAKIKQ